MNKSQSTKEVNITEHKRAEEALRKSEAKYRAIVETTDTGFVILDCQGRVLDANPEYVRLTGHSELREIIGRCVTEWTAEHEKERNAKAVAQCIRDGQIRGLIIDYVDSEGRITPIEINATTQEENESQYIITLCRDITERRRAEEALRVSLSHQDALLAAVPDIIMEVDYQKIYRWANCRGLEFFGEDVVGKEASIYFDGEQKVYDTVSPLFNGNEQVIYIESWQRRKDGQRRLLAWWCRTLKDAQGVVTGALSTARDITENRRMEEELQKAQKLESLGLLAGGIAHDFNNLMGGIFGYIDLASEGTNDSKVTSYLSRAMNTIDRARALTQQLLTFAKGGAPVQQIGTLFPFVEETARFALSGANISCRFDVPQDLWACNFDKNQIGQVIDNLIINAQQAMPVGGTIDLTARNITLAETEHPLLKKGNYVKISVKDSGIGIPKELIARIFDPFFTTKTKGHGLGLATCYSIINRHGGCIDVESEPGKGSSFKVYLPASTEAAASSIGESLKTHKGSGTFLIMDDEEVMRNTIRDMLESCGYSVVCKENGKDAIDFFAEETNASRTIAGLLFDLTVPGGMGGKTAIEEIRKTNTDIPAFVASGYADDSVMKNPAEYGFMESICKPFRKSELTEMLNRCMQPKK